MSPRARSSIARSARTPSEHARFQVKSDLDEDRAMTLALEELKAARTARRATIDGASVPTAKVVVAMRRRSVTGEQGRAGRRL